MTARDEVLADLARAIPALDHPVRVAIDGMTGVGKTTLREELAAQLRSQGRLVIEASGDDFHHQREHRYGQGRMSPRGYYEDAYNYAAMAEKLLAPLGPGGNGRIRLRHHELESDEILDGEPVPVVNPAYVLLVDGSFLMRPEVASLWDFHVLVEASRAVSASRQVLRDDAPADPEDPYHARYFGAYDLYVAECDPAARADVIVDNTDLRFPAIVT